LVVLFSLVILLVLKVVELELSSVIFNILLMVSRTPLYTSSTGGLASNY